MAGFLPPVTFDAGENGLPDETSDYRALIGSLVRVVDVDPDADSFYGRLSDGRVAHIQGQFDNFPHVGQMILVGNGGWYVAPEYLWTAGTNVANVSQLLDDGRVLLDDGLTLKTLDSDSEFDLSVGNAIEYDEVGNILSVLSQTPLRSDRFARQDEPDVLEYLRSSDGKLSFDDFGGYADVVSRAQELIATQIRGREYLDAIGARPVRGVLFTGPPGTGKTHLARIIASVSDADFYLVRGPEIVSKWLGDTEGILRRIFEAARDGVKGRAIIFFDEIDSIAERRSGDSHEASKRLVAQLLTLMDGFDDKGKGVMVIAATNRVETLDPAPNARGSLRLGNSVRYAKCRGPSGHPAGCCAYPKGGAKSQSSGHCRRDRWVVGSRTSGFVDRGRPSSSR